jgi:flagellar hook-basal body complex protein FliE
MSAIPPVTALGGDPLITRLGMPQPVQQSQGAGFGDILTAGMKQVESKLATADNLVQRFALDDSVPIHQVTYALEQARMSVELAMQVRTRLVEGYRELMNMQL